MSALSEVQREVYISQEWLDSVTTALSNVLSWRIIKLCKKKKKAISCICIFFFALLVSEPVVVLQLQYWGLWCQDWWNSAPRLGLPPTCKVAWAFPSGDPASYSSARLVAVGVGFFPCLWLSLIWKVTAKMMLSFLRVRLRENVMPKLKCSDRHFPEEL